MPTLVVDSCVAAKWFMEEPDSDRAAVLLGEGFVLLAPDFILAELGNILWKSARSGRITKQHATDRLSIAAKYFTELRPSSLLLDDSLRLAQERDHPFYDCLYVVAARVANVPLITSDTKLIAKLAGTPDAGRVILLADWK